MRVKVYESSLRLIEDASEILFRTTHETHGPLGVATGSTFEPIYKHFLANYEMPKDKTFVALDEYFRLEENHPSSFRQTLLRQLVIPAGLEPENLIMPPNTDNQILIDQFESMLQEIGPIELQLLGIGSNGHIAFNEPGSERESRTRKVKLSKETIAANSKHFEGQVPGYAITQGVQTIWQSKKILLVATGREKAKAIASLFGKTLTPASYIADHPNLEIMVDSEAGALIPDDLKNKTV
ncbi:MAG: glucosamine-6-phosphate deaminase [Microbacteriaceae bacterium]|nr:glucosamine-6-phosphate deaminase [Microbacteriaceae bacterium]